MGRNTRTVVAAGVGSDGNTRREVFESIQAETRMVDRRRGDADTVEVLAILPSIGVKITEEVHRS
jgi:hypothetical protein